MWSACIFILGTMTGNQSVLVFVCSFLTYQFLLTTAASPPTPSSPKANTDQSHCCECYSITRTIKVVSQLLGHVFIPDSSSGVPWTQKSGTLCCESQATKGSLFKPGVGQNIGLGALPAAKDFAFSVHSVPWCNRYGWLGIKNQLSLCHSSYNFIFPNPLQAGSGVQLVFRCSVTNPVSQLWSDAWHEQWIRPFTSDLTACVSPWSAVWSWLGFRCIFVFLKLIAPQQICLFVVLVSGLKALFTEAFALYLCCVSTVHRSVCTVPLLCDPPQDSQHIQHGSAGLRWHHHLTQSCAMHTDGHPEMLIIMVLTCRKLQKQGDLLVVKSIQQTPIFIFFGGWGLWGLLGTLAAYLPGDQKLLSVCVDAKWCLLDR